MKPSHIEVVIEELVLHGFAPGDRRRIGDAIERELARLLAVQGLPAFATGLALDRIDGGTFQATPGAPAGTLGGQVAQQVYQQVTAAAQAPAGRAES
jgi:hypothetical protein